MSQDPSPLPPYTSRTCWLSDGRAVLRFCPVRWDYYSQRLEINSYERQSQNGVAASNIGISVSPPCC